MFAAAYPYIILKCFLLKKKQKPTNLGGGGEYSSVALYFGNNILSTKL